MAKKDEIIIERQYADPENENEYEEGVKATEEAYMLIADLIRRQKQKTKISQLKERTGSGNGTQRDVFRLWRQV